MGLSDTLIQNLFGLASGLVGAAVGGLCTLHATDKAIREENGKEQRREDKEVRNMLAALQSELTSLWGFHMRRIGETIEKMPEGQALEFYYPLTQNYFTVYDANASMLGRVANDELRNSIVVTYHKCKKVVDNFKYNNELFRQYRDLACQPESPRQKQVMEVKYKELQAYAAVIRSDHFELKGYAEQLSALLDKELKKMG